VLLWDAWCRQDYNKVRQLRKFNHRYIYLLLMLAFSSVVIDDLITHHGEENVVYIYCDYGDQTNQTLVNILGSLLRQLLVTSTFVPEAITTLLESRKKHGQIVEVGDISEMLKALLLQRNNCNFLCLDALDELEPHTRFALLKALHTDFSTIRIFLTGRPHIQPEVDGALQTKLDAMHITADGGDIRGYLTHEIEKDMNINPGDMNDQLKEEILEAITRKAGGMYAIHFSAFACRMYLTLYLLLFVGFSFRLCTSVWSSRSRQRQQDGRPSPCYHWSLAMHMPVCLREYKVRIVVPILLAT